MRGSLLARWLPTLTAALALGAAGCVENDQSLVIVGNFALDDKCEAPIMGGKIRSSGLFDIGLASTLNTGFFMVPRVQNFLPPSAGMGGAGGGGGMMGQGMIPVEMNHVQLTGFDVDLITDPDQPITGVLPPGVPGLTRLTLRSYGGLLTAGGGSITSPVEVINSNAASLLLGSRAIKGGPSTVDEPYQTLTVRLRARASRGGAVLVSAWIDFPVEICAFCLAMKAGEPGLSAFNPGTGSLLECPDTPVDEKLLLSTCIPQQDQAVSCCLKDRQVLCGKTIPHKTSEGGGM